MIVFQENHTFDNYFGTFPGADGTAGKALPAREEGFSNDRPCSHLSIARPDPGGHEPHLDLGARGLRRREDGRVRLLRGEQGHHVLLRAGDIPRYWKAAQQYVLCESYFTPS